MKRFLSILLSSIFILSSFISCQRNSAQIKSLQRMEEGVSNPTTIQELEDAISKYQSRIDDLVTAEAQVGIWYKILGTRYLDKRMYGKALECFQKAAGYYPDNANLFYYIGVCARQMGIASIGVNNTATATQKDYFRMSEKAYLTALDKDPKYYRAMYAIGILYLNTKKQFLTWKNLFLFRLEMLMECLPLQEFIIAQNSIRKQLIYMTKSFPLILGL